MEVGSKVRTWTSWSNSSVAAKGGSVPKKGQEYRVRSIRTDPRGRLSIALDEVINEVEDGFEPHFDAFFFTEICYY